MMLTSHALIFPFPNSSDVPNHDPPKPKVSDVFWQKQLTEGLNLFSDHNRGLAEANAPYAERQSLCVSRNLQPGLG